MSDQEQVQQADQPVEKGESQGLSLEAAGDLASSSMKPDPFWFRFGDGLTHLLVKLLAFILGVLIDIVLGIYALVKGIFVFLYKGVVGIGKIAIKVHRIFHDVDIWGKLTFLINGLGNLARKQWLDGFVFLGVQLVFNIFMFLPINGVMMGYSNLYNFFHINDGAKWTDKYGQIFLTGASDARLSFINGMFTILVIVAFFVVYVQAIKAMYDNYQIVHYMEFRAAKESAIVVLQHQSDYPENLNKLNKFRIKRLMRDKYGYDELTSRYIAHLDFHHAIDRDPLPFFVFLHSIAHFFYRGYDALRNKCVRHLDYFSPLERFLGLKEKPVHNAYGFEKVLTKEQDGLLQFRHTFDKYNDYFSKGRDEKALSNVLSHAQELYNAVLAKDPVSERNGIKPFALQGKLSVRLCVSGVVGYFGLPLDLAREATKRALKAIDSAKKTVSDPLQIEAAAVQELKTEGDIEKNIQNAFEKEARTDVLRDADGRLYAYRNYGEMRPFLFSDHGVKAFHPDARRKPWRSNERTPTPLYGWIMASAIKKSRSVSASDSRDSRDRAALVLEEGYVIFSSIGPFPSMGRRTGLRKRYAESSAMRNSLSPSLSLPGSLARLIPPLSFHSCCSVFVASPNGISIHLHNKFVWSAPPHFDQVIEPSSAAISGKAPMAYTFFSIC